VPSDGFPIFRSFPPVFLMNYPPLPDTKIELTYKQKLKELLYVAEVKLGDSSKQVIVKFAHSYNVDAHKICASNGCAPMLYFAGEVSFLFPVINLNSSQCCRLAALKWL
jgi:hypothetical protein